ncbi:MAG: glycyl-radical enzyme activating protein [Clostridia bacterium]|nr:glycyl-radical enzyme activating protein [Clostridia bacterium]MBP3495322.1 glycyl-radical enzyme activating protein [Clostridia bacterium]
MKATIFDIQRNSFVDGPGIRTTVFFKGCNLKCAWCHNPESQNTKSELMVYSNKCIQCGKCTEKCPYNLKNCDLCGKCALFCLQEARMICGKNYTVDEVVSEVLKDKAYYEGSGGGVTLSGGECMLQIDFATELLKECKKNNIHTAIDTAGNVPFEYFMRVLPYTDLFLYDIKCFDKSLHKKYTGVSNELILGNLKRLLSLKSNIWIRIPIIPSVNDNAGELLKIKDFIYKNGEVEKIELLPYHKIGEHKYEALGMELHSFDLLSKERLLELQNIFNI